MRNLPNLTDNQVDRLRDLYNRRCDAIEIAKAAETAEDRQIYQNFAASLTRQMAA